MRFKLISKFIAGTLVLSLTLIFIYDRQRTLSRSDCDRTYLIDYVLNKFSDYGLSSVNPESLIITQRNAKQWNVEVDPNTKLLVNWDGTRPIAETTYVEINGNVVYKR